MTNAGYYIGTVLIRRTGVAGDAQSEDPVTPVTGAFCSGKSTAVRRLVELAAGRGEEVAVVSASLSPSSFPGAQMVIAADEEVVERSPGCPCCAVRHDLVRVLRNLGERRHRPARIIVETSAVADVATLEQTLMAHPALRRVVTLDGVGHHRGRGAGRPA